MNGSDKNLVCITTCNRLEEVKKYIWDYLKFTASRNDFDFVLALDGGSKEYIDFAIDYGIPIIYSEKREGVGLSKNRVLEKLSDYKNYFFIEDDVEILNTNIFDDIIDLHNKTKIHHFCLPNKKGGGYMEKWHNQELIFSKTGGAQFAFYSKEGLKKVGGFDTRFAKYKRFGHTEHSYRFYHQGLQKAPFIFSDSWSNQLLGYHPPHVTKTSSLKFNEFGIIQEEQDLINQKTKFLPLKTGSPYYLVEPENSNNEKLMDLLNGRSKKFPLTKGESRKQALAAHYALRISKTKELTRKFVFFMKSFWHSPTNVALKHYIKTEIFGRK